MARAERCVAVAVRCVAIAERCVAIASPPATGAARFMSGFVHAHWSVEARKNETVRQDKLPTGFNAKLGKGYVQ